MKGQGYKAVWIIILLGCVFGGFLGVKLFHHPREHPKSFPNKNLLNSLPPTVQIKDEAKTMYHKYGRPVQGPLLWENDRKFHDYCAKYNTSVRMSAFQTTLPDPLPGEEYNVSLAADILAGTVVPPGKIFSTNQTVGPYSGQRGFREGPAYFGTQVIKTIGGGVCKIATTLYNVATLANMKIIERKSHGMLVPYVPPGQDATVSENSKDFKFKNITDDPILIWADTKDNTLYMAIYGRNKSPKVVWQHQILARVPMRTIYQISSNLKAGEEKVIIPGADGLTVRNWLIIEYHNGKSVKKDLGVDYYRPMLRIIERGTSK